MLPVNPPSPALRGVRGLRSSQYEVIGSLAPSLGLHSRRKMTSLNRRAPRSPHTPDAIGSVLLRCYVCLVGLRGVFLRGSLVFRAGRVMCFCSELDLTVRTQYVTNGDKKRGLPQVLHTAINHF